MSSETENSPLPKPIVKSTAKPAMVNHTIEPFYTADSKILILGTMPSPKSRETGFYYGHPQNRFWRVLAEVLSEPLPGTVEEKMAMLGKHRIALWDVLQSCQIKGADDSSIRNPVPNDMHTVLSQAQIKTIFTTGKKAAALYKKYCFPQTGMEAVSLPSTSPANCGRYSYQDLVLAYQRILDDLR